MIIRDTLRAGTSSEHRVDKTGVSSSNLESPTTHSHRENRRLFH
jgi:hypothetical protein